MPKKHNGDNLIRVLPLDSKHCCQLYLSSSPVSTFTGAELTEFYIKTSLSHCGNYLASGKFTIEIRDICFSIFQKQQKVLHF